MFKRLPELTVPPACNLEKERCERRKEDFDLHAIVSVAADNLRKWLETGKGVKFRSYLPSVGHDLFRETYGEQLEEQGYTLYFEGHNVYVLSE